MRIGILSDTHGRQHTVAAALRLLDEQGVELLLHCGDIDDAETVRLFGGRAVHFVFGNCDGQRAALAAAMLEIGATLHDGYGHLELAGRTIGWTHGDNPRLFRDLENSGAYNYLFYGHTHVAEQHCRGPTLIVNPGALHRAKQKSFAVLDLSTSKLELIVV